MKQILDWNAYTDAAIQAAAEGIVMLKNENAALPLQKGQQIALFGRMQLHYYKSGTGSGGMVNVHQVIDIPHGLTDAGVRLYEPLRRLYADWDAENPPSQADGWGSEAWSQAEMPLDDSVAKETADACETAVCIIARTAGEEQDNFDGEGSYRLTQTEISMLQTVRRHFRKMVVLLNVANIIDMNDIENAAPDAILYVWQGGMTGGAAAAAVLTGEISPSGKLPDTIALQLADYPSHAFFGDTKRNCYAEDIYVGYRYFETAAKEKVRYPFGFGLSYTTFAITPLQVQWEGNTVTMDISVTNTGAFAGKEVVQAYCEAPQGTLCKPLRVLCGFRKTQTLAPQASETIRISFDCTQFASYDDSGASGQRFCKVLEAGDYRFYVGSDVRSAAFCFTRSLQDTIVCESLQQAFAPVAPFQRMKPLSSANSVQMAWEDVPQSAIDDAQRRLDAMPTAIPMTGNQGITLADVRNGKASMEAFIAQMDEDDLCCIVRGEGMGSPKARAGTAAVFGGITPSLAKLGIPCACCDDGPSGMRLDDGTKVMSLPIGTMLAATFNPELLQTLFAFTGMEMAFKEIDILLGPGMNIHRHPLNGRNFEYFSEDPLLTGKMAAAIIRGLQSSGVTGTLKHFCGNNQETNRHHVESIVSERALREIYLHGFEIAVKEGNADAIMTTYSCLNGQRTPCSYDLNSVILRKEWGFRGFTMTDWWTNLSECGKSADTSNFAAMARAQNDIYMVCADTEKNQGNLRSALADGTLQIAELQRNAANLCRFLMHSIAMDRKLGCAPQTECINMPEDPQADGTETVFYPIDTEFSFPVETLRNMNGKRRAFVLCIRRFGRYEVSVTGSSASVEPLELVVLGSHAASFSFQPQMTTQSHDLRLFSNFTIMRLVFPKNDISVNKIVFKFKEELHFN